MSVKIEISQSFTEIILDTLGNGPGGTNAGNTTTIKIVDASGTLIGSATTPAIGSSATIGNFKVYRQTPRSSVGAGTVPRFAIEALTGATIANGYALECSNNASEYCYSTFDIVAAIDATIRFRSPNNLVWGMSTSTSPTTTTPLSWKAGDLILISLFVTNQNGGRTSATTDIVSTGLTFQRVTDGTNEASLPALKDGGFPNYIHGDLFYAIAPVDATNQTFQLKNGGTGFLGGEWMISVIQGAHPTAPFDAVSVVSADKFSPSATGPIITPVTTTHDDSVIFTTFYNQAAYNAQDAGYVIVPDNFLNSPVFNCLSSTKFAAGATVSPVATTDGIGRTYVGMSVALRPAPAVVVTAPAPPSSAPTYTAIGTNSLTLNNVPGLRPSSVVSTVTGAGTSAWNGVYVQDFTSGGGLSNGKTYLTKDSSHAIGWDGVSSWLFYAARGNITYAYSAPIGSDNNPPPAGWTVSSGSAPAPSLTNSITSSATSLNIQRATDAGFTTGLTTFAGVTPSTNYADNTVSAGTTYYYRYVEVNAVGATPGPASSVTTLAASHKDVMIFSSGTLFADVGAGPVEFALVQDIAVMFSAQRKGLYNAAQISRFPLDAGIFGAEAYLQAVSASFSAAALQMLLGSAQAGVNPVTQTLGKTITLPTFSAVLTTQSTGGLQQIYTFSKVLAPGVALPFHGEDFTMPQFAMRAYPIGGALATVQMQF